MTQPAKFLLKRLFFISFIFIGLSANSQYNALLNKTYVQRYRQLDSLLYSDNLWKLDSAKAYSIISKIKEAAIKANDKELLMECDLGTWSYKKHSGKHNPALYKNALLDVLKTAEKEKLVIWQIRLNYLLSNEAYVNDQFGEAFEYQMRFYNQMKNVSDNDFPFKKWCTTAIGSVFYSFQDYETAKKYYKEAEGYAPSYRKNEDVNVFNSLGLVYRQTAKYDSALYYFNKALDICIKDKQDDWKHIVQGNIGITYYYQKQYDKALPLLQEDIRESMKAKDYENAANSIIKLADILHSRNQYDSAFALCLQARGFISGVWHPYRHLVPLYRLLAKLELHKGNSELGYKYIDSAMVAQDSLANRRKMLLLEHARHKVELERHNAELDKVMAINKLDVRTRNGAIALLLLAIMIVLLFWNRQKILRKKLHAEKDIASSRLKHAQEKLSSFTSTLHDKNELLEKSTQEIERLQQELNKKEGTKVSNEVITELHNATILTDREWEEFREMFEQVYPGFLMRMKDKLPDLTPAETRFLSLSKMNLENKDMANMLGIGASAMRNYRYRLRKKLNLDEDVDFSEYVADI